MIVSKQVRFFLRNALSDPAALPRVRRRLIEALSRPPTGMATTYFGEVRYDVDLSLHRLAKKYYYKTHEMFLDRVFKKFLKDGDIFIDIGANCGYWSAVALSRVGKNGAVHAFEPVPVYFKLLERLATNNPDFQVYANNAGLGSTIETMKMAVVLPREENFANFDTNIGSSSILPGYLDHDKHLVEMIDVPVTTLDAYIAKAGIDLDRVGLIKIDTEGFEPFVLDGMKTVLSREGRKVPILCEALSDTSRHHLLDANALMSRFEANGYKCLDATTLKPMHRNNLNFEENIVCIGAKPS